MPCRQLTILVATLFCLSIPALALASNKTESLRVDGIKRTVRLHVPKLYQNGSLVPLVIVLHGALGNSATAGWDSRMSERSDIDDFVVAYPNGVGTTWNAGECCGRASSAHIEDIVFLRQLINQLEAEYSIDPARIYVTGISNGGMLAYRVGREMSDLVAAIAPIAGCMYPVMNDLSEPVSVIAFNGTDDPVILFNGGDSEFWWHKVHSTPVSETISYWVDRDHCRKKPVTDVVGDVTQQLYSGGDNGTEVCLYTIHGGKHTWPGGRSATLVYGDKNSREISATALMCQFFWAHPKHLNSVDPQVETRDCRSVTNN